MKSFGKLGVFAIALAALLLAPSTAFAEPAGPTLTPGTPNDWRPSVAEILPESYRQVDLHEQNMLTVPDTCGLQTSVPEKTFLPGIMLTGTAAQFNGARIPVNKQFTFTDEWPVGMACLDALKQSGTEATVKAQLYLDSSDQPLATFNLKTDKSTTKWNSAGNLTQNVLGEIPSGDHSASIGFEISGVADDASVTILMRSIEFMYNSLPVMSFNLATSTSDLTDAQRESGYGTIDDMNSSRDHSKRTSGSVGITVPTGYKNEFGGAQSNVSSLALDYIRGRGNSTWKPFGKRPYRFKLDKKTDLFGMGKNKHWVLLANAMDSSLVRNRITLWLGREIGLEYTPKCVPVDVVMNGEYYGSYLLCEQVRVGENRVDIGEHKEGLDYHEAGYLFSCAQEGKDERDAFETTHKAMLLDVTPSFEDNANEPKTDDSLSNIDERISYLRGYIQEAEDALYGEGFKNALGKSYEDYFDLDSVMKYLWVQTVSWNGDAFGTGSTYFYKKPDTRQGQQGKIYWGPLWDFDIAWEFNPNSEFTPTEAHVFHGIDFPWIHQLHGDLNFLAEYWGCWKYVIRPALDKMTRDNGLLDQYYAETKVSWAYDREQSVRSSADDSWITEGDGEHQFSLPENISFSTAVNTVKNSITNMKSAINSFGFTGLKNSVVTVTLVLEGGKQQITLPRNATDVGRFFPNVKPAEDELFLGWKRDDGTIFDLENDKVANDMTLTPSFVKKADATKAQGLFLSCPTMTLGLNDSYALGWSITPHDAQDKEITWTSSDKSIAILDTDNTIKSTGKPGVATITGTLTSGKSASVTVTVLDVTRPNYNELKSITVVNPDLRLAVDAYDQVRLDFQPQPVAPYVTNVEWTSSDPSVAEVDTIGVVHALKPGAVVIGATSLASGISTTCKVTVTEQADDKAAKARAANPIVVSPAKVKLKATKLKKKTVKVKAKKAFRVKSAKGKVTYKRIGISCKKKLAKQAKKKIKIAKNGKVTCKKGLKKGTYKVKVKLKAAGNSSYLPATKTTTLTIVVK